MTPSLRWTAALLLVTAGACSSQPSGGAAGGAGASLDDAPGWDVLRDSTTRVARVDGLSDPVSVLYDADQDVWFVANAGAVRGDSTDDGFIARVSADGVVDSLHFMTGSQDTPLEDPRGMAIVGDFLWVADNQGVHAFDRHSGGHRIFVDFTYHDAGFLSDMAFGADDALYVTDRDKSRVYRMGEGKVTVAAEGADLDAPGGIAWDREDKRFVLSSSTDRGQILAWAPDGAVETVASGGAGVESVARWDGHTVVAASDSTLQVVEDGGTRPIVRLAGMPADIGVDGRHGRVAVPYPAAGRVDLWTLPRGQ